MLVAISFVLRFCAVVQLVCVLLNLCIPILFVGNLVFFAIVWTGNVAALV